MQRSPRIRLLHEIFDCHSDIYHLFKYSRLIYIRIFVWLFDFCKYIFLVYSDFRSNFSEHAFNLRYAN